MTSSGLVDIHVLEETVSRVSDLTKSITKQVGIVEQVSQHAHKALGPTSQQTRSLGLYRDNLVGLVKVYEQIEQATKDVNDLGTAIEAGPAKSGWQTYIALVIRAQELSSELALSPQLKRFPQLPESASNQFNSGISKLLKYVRRLGRAVFTPLDAVRYIDSNDPLPQFNPEELVAFSKLITALDRWPDVIPSTDKALTNAIESFYKLSSEGVLQKMGARHGQYSIQSFTELCEQYKGVVNNGLYILLNRNATRMRKFVEINTQLCQREIASATSKYTANTVSSAPSPPSHANTASGGPSGAAGPPGAPGSLSKPNKPVLALKTDAPSPSANPVSSPVLSPRTAKQAPIDPRIQQQHQQKYESPTSASARSNGPSTPVASKSNNVSFATGNVGGSGMSGVPSITVNSPGSTSAASSSGGGSSSSPLRGGTTTTSTANDWAPLETVENVQKVEITPDELSRAKQESLNTLVTVFQGIEQKSRRSPITSEFGVSGASIQFMQTLKQISTHSHGVDVVLSEIPTRAYLSKPPPPWAQRSEPTAAGRANPVSQYFADCIECLYSNLHQVSMEQLKDTTRTGIFMLTNLTAIEHYITDSKEDTLSTVKQKSQIMDSMGEVAIQRFQRLMELSFKEYLTDWSKLAPVLIESTMTTGANPGKLSSKDREVVKEKFRTFNSEFEILTERQHKYQVVDPVLRSRMGQEVKKLIGPLYLRFYSKHANGDFTKNIHKYIKYDVDAFNRALAF